ncbi:MAG: CDP-diacylglycerol--serine O-phosphatidyltransferase [Candidatus Hydrogenedentes bacterium]|nr:CDP-diacylglycerol--serine O-phosphatidyltransferase [Candidatus Hydrogenedentota bacterium]
MMKQNPFKNVAARKGFKLQAPQRRKRAGVKRRPINVLASAITTLNLYCGISSIFAGIEGHFEKAAYLIFAAIVMDMLDGSVAKMTKSVSEFGKQLDSLCDVVSFGVAPAVLIFTVYLPEEVKLVSRTGAVMAIIYAICTALRLARFNVYQAEIRDYFVGLPSPAAAATIASFVLFTEYYGYHVAFWVLGPLTLSLAYMMVSTLRYPKDKMKSMVLAPRHGFRLLAIVAVAIAIFDQASRHSPSIVLFPMAACYCLFGVVDGIYRRFFLAGGRSKAAGEGESGVTAGPPSKTGDLL